MRLRNTFEALISDGTDRYSILARDRVNSFMLINQSNEAVLVGHNNENPYIELGEGQSITFNSGENSIWGDSFVRVNFGTATIKKVVVLLTKDLGEINLP